MFQECFVARTMTEIVHQARDLLKGSYPTAVEPLRSLSSERSALWIKRDDQTHPLYGGNKIRKLELILPDVIARNKTRIVTVGAVGSHHVLATAVFGARAGLGVEAMLVPQRRTEQVEESLRADLTQGLVAHAARTYVGAAIGMITRSWGDGYLLPMGGSTVVGSMGYVEAARELAEQVRLGAMPEPDLIVVTVGSGGTAAGIAAGLAVCGLKTRVLGVVVATPVFAVQWLTRYLMRRCHARAKGTDARALDGILAFTSRYLGTGYGEPTKEGDRATQTAAEVGIVLDPTYTAKTFAAALDVVATGDHKVVLYWHTLSSAPMGPLISEQTVSPKLMRLLR